MARYREPPRCMFCNKVIATGRYKDQSNIPITMQLFGDTFEGWEFEDHECEEEVAFKKEIADKLKDN